MSDNGYRFLMLYVLNFRDNTGKLNFMRPILPVVCRHVIVGIGLLAARKFVVANNMSANKLHIVAHFVVYHE